MQQEVKGQGDLCGGKKSSKPVSSLAVGKCDLIICQLELSIKAHYYSYSTHLTLDQ